MDNNELSEVGFARKYRSDNFDDSYMGEQVKKRITSRLSNPKNIPNVILLEGTRGGGKTTAARIISKVIHCENPHNGIACNKCQMCQMINDELINAEFGANTLGVMEVNASVDNGVQAVKDITEEAMQSPQYPCKRKVIILDECHRLSDAAQNALLKLLEEPPAYLVMILATTNPEKLLEPVLSRCTFTQKIRPAVTEDLVNRMMYICEKENIAVQESALKKIAKLKHNNPRESLNMLENVAKNYNRRCTLANVIAESDEVATEVFEGYLKASRKGLKDILIFDRDLQARSIQPREFFKGLTEFVIDCIKIKFGLSDEEYSIEYARTVKEFFKDYYTEDIDCLLQVLEQARKTISADPDMGEQVVLMTAMRIGKVKLLSIGLQNEKDSAEAENAKGVKEAAEQAKEQLASMKGVEARIDGSMFASTFGSTVREIKPGAKPSIVSIERKEDKSDGKGGLSESDIDDLIKELGGTGL